MAVTPPIPDDLLWQAVDGTLDASQRESLEAALAADPALGHRLELMHGTRALMATVGAEPVPEMLALNVKQALAKAGREPARVIPLVPASPARRWFALVAAVAILVIGGSALKDILSDTRVQTGQEQGPGPSTEMLAKATHEFALFEDHRQAVLNTDDLQAASTYPASVSLPDFGVVTPRVSLDRWTLDGWTRCEIGDCPAVQFFGHEDQIPVSYFVMPSHHMKFEIPGYPYAAETRAQWDFRLISAPDGMQMVAWNEGAMTHALIAKIDPEKLMQLAGAPSVANAPTVWTPSLPKTG